MTIDEALDNIRRSYGLRRLPVEADRNLCLDLFRKVGDAMLDWKGTRFDYETVRPYAELLVSWALAEESCKANLTRGFLFKGATGRGKTFLLQVFAEWLKYIPVKYTLRGEERRMAIEFANSRTIANEYADKEKGGSVVIDRYSRIPVLMIDDIGAEGREQNSFGNRVNVINDILDKRQERNLITFGTTNFNELTAEAGYDDRMKRRINALFNIVSMNHKQSY